MMQGIIASRLALDEHRVRIVVRDVGGSFGIKIHTSATRSRPARCR